MMRKIYTTLLLIMVFLCCGADDYVGKYNPESLKGSWITNSSSCVLNIDCISSYFEINIYDSNNNPLTVDISNVQWDGEYLTFTTYCQETKWTVHHKISPVSPCTISDNMTGDTKLKNNIWRKKQCQIPNGS